MISKATMERMVRGRIQYHMSAINFWTADKNPLDRPITQFEFHMWHIDRFSDMAIICEGNPTVDELDQVYRAYRKITDGFHAIKDKGDKGIKAFLAECYQIDHNLSVRSSEPEYRHLAEGRRKIVRNKVERRKRN